MTLWINGDWVTGQGALRVKRNPVSGEVLWQGNDADAAQVGQACRAARAAFPRWARLSFGDRQVRVERFAGLLESNKAELTATPTSTVNNNKRFSLYNQGGVNSFPLHRPDCFLYAPSS